jgi:hypothetical protein
MTRKPEIPALELGLRGISQQAPRPAPPGWPVQELDQGEEPQAPRDGSRDGFVWTMAAGVGAADIDQTLTTWFMVPAH